jgi:hypothetical protein
LRPASTAPWLCISPRPSASATGLGYGSDSDLEEMEEDDADELDPSVLDGVYLAGERFDRMVKRMMVS